MIKAPALREGDIIGLCAPARKVSRDEMAYFRSFFTSAGFRIKEGTNLYGELNQFSSSDEERAADINAFLDDHEVKAIVFARGGYGCARIADLIHWHKLQENPKWLSGYSDITVLLNQANNLSQVQSLHCTMAYNMKDEGEEVQKSNNALLAFLKGQSPEIELPIHQLNRTGQAEGRLVGGNLSVLFSTLGSVSFPQTEGNILFIEDLDEYLYHIDRMMTGLKRAGKLQNLAALIVGGMTKMNDNAVPFGETAEEIIRHSVEDYNYPIFFGIPSGHLPLNLPLPIGAPAKIVSTESGFRLSFP